MRHRDPELCSIGSLGLYLLARFELTDETEYMDFGENKTWFNRKSLKAMVVLRGNDKVRLDITFSFSTFNLIYIYINHFIYIFKTLYINILPHLYTYAHDKYLYYKTQTINKWVTRNS